MNGLELLTCCVYSW